MTNQNQLTRFRPFFKVPYQYRCFFCRTPKTYTRGVWVTSGKVKPTIKNQDTLHIENTIYRVLQKTKNIDASFAESPQIQEQLSFEHGIWATSVK